MPSLLPLSAVIITKNEEDRIARCLRSLLPLCHEVIVLDSGSTDATVAIARAEGAIVEHQDWLGYAAQKNAAIARASQPWVILLDADEWLEAPAQQCLRNLFTSGRHEHADVWLLMRRVHFLGHRMRAGSYAREPVERLFRSHMRHAIRLVHEYLDTAGASVLPSEIVLEHDTARSAESYWQKLQSYARLWANEQFQLGRRAWLGRGWLAAIAYALKNLVIRGGIIDGASGIRFHLLHARYARLKYNILRSLSK
jgi:(heptosyl)LPS beta-1,4-glucosyltransferase